MRRRIVSEGPYDIAIVGLACCYSKARSVDQFWENIVHKVDGIVDPPLDRLDPSVFYDPTPGVEDKVYCKKAGWLGSHFAFNPLKYGTMPRIVEGGEPDQFLVLRTVYEAMEDAGYLNKHLDGKRVSFILGRGNYLGAGLAALLQRGLITEQTLDIIRGMHPELTSERLREIKTTMRQSLPEFGAETAPGLIPNITTGRVANRLDFMGKNFTIDAACASSLIAAELGVRELITGQNDMVLVGGVHVFTNVPFLQVFAAMRALSPTATIRPFDADCDGTMPGEGVGVLVLKRLEDAEAAGDRIYAVIKGIGSSSDGKAVSVTAPRVDGEELALRRAYEGTDILPQSIGLIEAHGTGTPVGDAVEAEALRRVFGQRDSAQATCAIGSVKSMIGHAMPAAGAAGIIKTALALYHRVLPPTLNCRKPLADLADPKSRFYVNTETRPWVQNPAVPRRAGVNAFGFGGVNAHVVLEEYKGANSTDRPTLIRYWDSELTVIAAETREKLRTAVTDLQQYIINAPSVELRDIAYTRSTSLGTAPYRVSVVASSLADLRQKLERVEQRLADPACKQIKDSGGIYYFEETPLRDSKLALMFPGEGSQYLNMLSDLCIHFPEVRECFDVADTMVDQKDRYAPSLDIFPPPFFSQEEQNMAEKRLWQIQRATEAVLTADGAVFTLLEKFGLKADMMVGHSAGEWVALAASGILDVNEFLGSFDRLDQMYRSLADDSSIPRMVMLAVGAGREKIGKLVEEIDCTVHIANDNCPNQVVIVVEPKDAERVLAQIQERGIFVEKLPYDRGYHTHAFTYICEPLRKYFSGLAIRAPRTPVFCCTTAELYPDDSSQILDHAANTFTRPLLFRQTIEAMYAAGARIFVEAGPRGNMTAFVDDILRGRPHLAVAIDQYRRPALTTLNNTIGILTALHVPLNLRPLYERRSPRVLTWDPNKDRRADPDNSLGTVHVSLGSPRLQTPKPISPTEFAGPAGNGKQPPPPLPRVDVFPELEARAEPLESELAPVTVRSQQAQPQRHSGNGNGAGPRIQTFPQAQMIESHFQLMETFLETQEAVMRAMLGTSGSAALETVSRSPSIDFSSSALIAEPAAIVSPAVVSPTAVSARAETPTVQEVQESSVTARVEAAEAPATAVNVSEVLLKIVSERTGYPVEMLGLDLDMEAELGIDSIKRVEVLSALQQIAGGGQLSGETAMEEVAKLKTLRQVLDFLEKASTPGESQSEKPGAVTATTTPRPFSAAGTISSFTPGQEVVVVCEIDPNEHLYVLDHSFDPIGSEWDLTRDRLCFVPMTVSVALMAEVAALLSPGSKVIGAKRVQASKWIAVEQGGPRANVTISAKRSGEQKVSVTITSPKKEQPGTSSTDLLAEATFFFAQNYPPAPTAEKFELVNPRKAHSTGPELYETRRMFHGPSFHGISSLEAMGDNGLLATLDTLPRQNLLRSDPNPAFHIDPFLLDAAGQLVGYGQLNTATKGLSFFQSG